MAHFQRPERGDFGQYDVDSKLAVGSVWRMRGPLGNASRVEIAIYGADGPPVRSNNPEGGSLPAPGTLPRDIIGKVTHTLKHLVFSSHGRIKYDNGQILDSEIEIGSGLWRADTLLFSQLKSHMAGGVIWLGGCALGNDNDGNIER